MTNWRGPGSAGKSPTRLRVRPWSDPRLLVGLLLVLGATVLGARLVAASDDTVEYWSVTSEVAPGDPVEQSDLRPTRIKLSGSAAGNYVRADEEFAAPLDDLVWAHDVSEGSLVGKDALVPSEAVGRGQLPLNVAQGAAPADLTRGDLVDVWVGPGPGGDQNARARQVLDEVRVVEAGGSGAAELGAAAQTVLVDVDSARVDPSVVAAVGSGHVTLVRVS